ncbi:MAG: transcriptional repressor LexA [Armatimonadaceae bacterium]
MAKGLTEKQRKILEFIIDFQREKGYPPTIRELGDAFQIGSLRGVTVHLDALKTKGFLTRDRTSRSIRVIGADPRDPNGARKTESAVRLPLITSLSSGCTDCEMREKIASMGQVERYVSIPEEIAAPATEHGFVIRVGATGIPNEPVLPGDLLIVRPQRTAVSGELIVLFAHNDLIVRRADGQETPDGSVPGEGEIIGRVVGMIRRY